VNKNQVTVAITGASGADYGIRLISWLNQAGYHVHVLVSDAARVVIATESNLELPKSPSRQKDELVKQFNLNPELISCWSHNNWSSPVASGSSAPDKMVICPCSTGTLSAVATGASNNLIERGADVILKERGTLVVVPRETPYSMVHIENMRRLTEAGGIVLPASPGFYHKPGSISDLIDFIVSRILDKLNIDNQLSSRWGYSDKQAESAGE
jgi:4-hydroxy-3-polyprenylbenzoate decarboxylase